MVSRAVRCAGSPCAATARLGGNRQKWLTRGPRLPGGPSSAWLILDGAQTDARVTGEQRRIRLECAAVVRLGTMTTPRSYPSTIADAVTNEIVIKKSRFIAHVAPAASPDAADEVITRDKKQYWDARHNCVAMVTGVLGDRARSSDDGEPSGTAGVPMLEVLRRRELTDVVAVVTRYFGGIKLGAGGLIRAYSGAVSEALDLAVIVRRETLTRVTLDVAHSDAGRIDNVLREWVVAHGARLDEPRYGATATFELWAPPAVLHQLTADVAAASAGSVVPVVGEDRIVDVP